MDETLLGLMEIVGPSSCCVILVWVVLRSRRRKGEPPMSGPSRRRASYMPRKRSAPRGDRRPLSKHRISRQSSGTGSPAAAGSRAGTSSTCSMLARAGRHALAGRRDRRGQDAGRLPADHLRPDREPGRGPSHPLRLAAEGAGGRRPAQPARPDRGDGPSDPRRDAHRRHAVRPQGAPAGPPAADPADHAGIAEPAAELSRQLRCCSRI